VVGQWLLERLVVARDMGLTVIATGAEMADSLPELGRRSPATTVGGRLAAAASWARRRPAPVTRVWWLNAVMVVTALLLWAFAIQGHHYGAPRLAVPWWTLGAVFFVGEAWVLHVHFGRSAYSFSLTEICYVLGLLFLSPNQLLITQVCGIGLALVVARRQSLLKLVFNLSHFTLETCVAIIVFRAISGVPDPSALRSWAAIFAAAAIVAIMGVVSIIAAISLSEGDFTAARWRSLVAFTVMGGLANTSLGLLAAVLIRDQPISALLLTLPAVVLGVAYRAHIRERRRHERMEFLFEAGQLMSRSTEMDTTVLDVLRHTRASLRAERAELVLLSADDGEQALRTVVKSDQSETVLQPVLLDRFERKVLLDLADQHARLLHVRNADVETSTFLGARQASDAMVCALIGETRMIGAVIISGRLGGLATFDREDLRQLEALAAQLSISLQNGQLERSLARLTELQEELEHQAFHDPLTGLANRVLFHERVAHAIERAARDQSPIAVLFLDLDDFKNLNDGVGHAAGDQVLVEVAKRMKLLLRPSDTAARLGGDEFAVLLEATAHETDAVSIAERIVQAIGVPIALAEGEVGMRGSVGIATAVGDSITADEMLRNADMAMYKAKAMGKGHWELFAPEMHTAALQRHQLKSDLLHSIERSQLRLQYQPIVHLPSGALFGVEALLRWEHPVRGLIPPDDFIAFAEESDLIVAMGRYVLEIACLQAMEWASHFPSARGLTISVNASGRELREPSFGADVEGIVRRVGLDPHRLILEVTESQMITDPSVLCGKLTRLKSMGVRLAIDDFGTGYSSLSSLRDLPVDILKIAKPLVTGPDGGEMASESFLAAILQLGESLNLNMIAEGVETPEQRDLLKRIRCPLAQGFLFGRPMDAADINSLLEAGMAERGLPLLRLAAAG
jgi:diguanylate cyclase (GGDEF)-like protein